VQPYGISDPNAPYINGNPSIGLQGSIPPAAAFEHPMREIVGVISKSMIAPDSGDLLQMAKSIRSQRLNYAEDTGAVNTVVVAYDPAIPSYTIGLVLHVKILHSNSAPVVTLDAGAGPRPVIHMNGSQPNIGDIPAGAVIEFIYDGTSWQMVNFLGFTAPSGTSPPVSTIYYINIPYCVDTSTTVNTIVAPFVPAVTTMNAGFICLVKVANTVTGAATLTVNALNAKAILSADGNPLLAGDLIAGDIVFFRYDGTNFYVTPSVAIRANVTFNVPSTGWPTVDAVSAALTRKTIAATALVTIQLAAGIFGPFAINHANADRILVKGTMLSTPPSYTDFAQTGNSAPARAADSATNINMLRARYGTEIRFSSAANFGNFAPEYAVGITNLGPSCPTFQDLLVTGSNTYGALPAPSYSEAAVQAREGRRLACRNVATWGCNAFGFSAHGGVIEVLANSSCYACGCYYSGFFAWWASGHLYIPGSIVSVGNGFGGLWCPDNGSAFVPGQTGASHCNVNGWFGVAASDCGMIKYYNSAALGNAVSDLQAADLGDIIVINGTYASYSPASPMGNNGGIIAIGSGPPASGYPIGPF
jgi:hypothetical protein